VNKEILYRYIQGLCTEAELLQVQSLLESDSDFRAECDLLKSIDAGIGHYAYPKSNKEKAWNAITQSPEKRIIPLYSRTWFRAAAVLVVLFSAFLVFKNGDSNKDILTIKANQQGEMFDLPDGSKVWLQKGSQLSFYNNTKEDIRQANLTGVGFFVVKPNDNKKFEVTNGHLKVLVLGTAFEVSPFSVAVEHGKVQVTKDNAGDTVFLNKQEKVDWDDKGLVQMDVDNEVAAWRSQSLKFKNESLSNIVESLEAYYQIKVIFDQNLLQKEFTMDFGGLDQEEVIQLLGAVTETKSKFSNQEYRFKR
jgi:ferric-dicitrate binding protein FerR (iron transport regulator)